jgi:hypothetical protein
LRAIDPKFARKARSYSAGPRSEIYRSSRVCHRRKTQIMDSPAAWSVWQWLGLEAIALRLHGLLSDDATCMRLFGRASAQWRTTSPCFASACDLLGDLSYDDITIHVGWKRQVKELPVMFDA